MGTDTKQQPTSSDVAVPDITDVFLCHNASDKAWVEELAEHIESETVDGTESGRPLRVFFDKWDIDVGQNFIQRINNGLTAARFVAVVISPEFINAPWTTFEWTHTVAQDPTNLQARLIPLFRRETSLDGTKTCDLPAPFRALNWIDFRKDTDFKRSYQRLIRRIRGLPPDRGKKRRPLATLAGHPPPLAEPRTAATPDRINDLILSNLLPVSDYPATIWSAPTKARRPDDVWSIVPESPGFILRGDRLYSFADLSAPDSVLAPAISRSEVKGDPVVTWKNDAVRWPWFIELLHRSLRNHLGKMGIVSAKQNRFFFKGPKEGTSRPHKNADDLAREVAAKKISPVDGSEFWVHHGAELRFVTLGEDVFLSVEPCYIFTSNGRQPLTGPRVTPLSMKWGGKERNAAILRHLVFWARTLGRGKPRIEIQSGAKPITILGIPALSRTTFGIEFDHIGLKALIAQVDDELAEVAKSIDSMTNGYGTSQPTDDDADT